MRSPSSAKCFPNTDYRTIRDTAITTAMDVSTDVLVVSFPIILLWKVRINFRQKIGLGISLCLSLVMVVVAIARMSGIKLAGGAVDIVWLVFWQQQECSIAVIMVSVSAFRSLFVANALSNTSPKKAHVTSYWKKRLLQRRSNKNSENSSDTLPQIPRAHLTGMRTMIQEARLSATWPLGSEFETLVPQDWRQRTPREVKAMQPDLQPDTTGRALHTNDRMVDGCDMV